MSIDGFLQPLKVSVLEVVAFKNHPHASAIPPGFAILFLCTSMSLDYKYQSKAWSRPLSRGRDNFVK